MSVINKKPFVETLIESLTSTQKSLLLELVNGKYSSPVLRSFINKNCPITNSDKGVSYITLEAQNEKFTGYLVYNNSYCVLLSYGNALDQKMDMISLNVAQKQYAINDEKLDINELRRLLEEVADHITSGEIDSGSATANQILAADGDGGAEWKDVADTITSENVEAGDAVQLFGFDSQGNLVKDSIPEGILVDQTVIEDSENAVSGGAVYDELADIKEDITDLQGEMEEKANVDGNYPTMTVGAADNLTPYSEDSGDDQNEPFIVQGTGCGNGTEQVDTGSLALLKEKRGNSVVVNQAVKIKTLSFATTDSNAENISDVDYTFIAGHKYLITSNQSVALSSVTRNTIVLNVDGITSLTNYGSVSGSLNLYSTDDVNLSSGFKASILDCSTSVTGGLQYWCHTPSADVTISEINVIDLTQWFGSNDNIPSDLLSHPENFFRYYQGSLAYNTGTLTNSNGQVLKTVGRNVWDEDWENGVYDYNTGAKSPNANYIRNKTPIKVIPNTQYHFEGNGTDVVLLCYDKDNNYIGLLPNTGITPANCCYLCFYIDNATYNHDITISIYYDGESGYDQYYPYEVLSEIDTGSETLRSAGSVADSKAPDGTITRRVGYVDLSTLTFTKSGNFFISSTTLTNVKQGNDGELSNLSCSKYQAQSYYNMYNNDVSGITIGDDYKVWIRDDSLTGTDTPTGILNYELATPTTEQGTSFSENVNIDDFGAMEISATSFNGVPMGNLIFYPVDYKAFIDTLYNQVGGDGNNVACIKNEGESLADGEPTSITGVVGKINALLPTLPTTAGKYRLAVTIADGQDPVYEWEAEE